MSTSTVVILAVLVGAAMLAWRRGSWAMTIVLGLVARLPAVTAGEGPAVARPRGGRRAGGGVGVASLEPERLDGVPVGVAGPPQVRGRLHPGHRPHRFGVAVKRRARIVRPSLTNLSRWQWWRLPAVEVGVRLCRVGLLSVWSSIEDVTVVFGGPRTGKTAVAGRPGPRRPRRRAGHLDPDGPATSCAGRCAQRGGRCSCSTPSAWPTWRRRSRSTR